MITQFDTERPVKHLDIGGKGINLVRLTQAGLTVPDGLSCVHSVPLYSLIRQRNAVQRWQKNI